MTQENNDSTEVLRVTTEGEFIWHPDADRLVAEGDFSQSPALPHILRALRKQRTWVGLTDEEIAAMLRQQQEEKKALYNLVAEQDKKIIDLAFKLAYAERSNEVEKELSK